MGTTVATNALLERKGEPTLLAITARTSPMPLRIGYQNRPRLFDRHIVLPEPLYERVVEIDERLTADGSVLPRRWTTTRPARAWAQRLRRGFRAPGDRPDARLALSRRTRRRWPRSRARSASPRSPPATRSVALMKLIGRGDTTVVDAYLSPTLRRYVTGVTRALAAGCAAAVHAVERRSGAGRADSGAGTPSSPGRRAASSAWPRWRARRASSKVIGFDMGGTSTDVSHFAGAYERSCETEVAGVRLRAPMMNIHTVAAGGGSICRFDGARLRVGPQSRRRRSGAGLLSPRRSADGDRLQRDAGPDPARGFSRGLRARTAISRWMRDGRRAPVQRGAPRWWPSPPAAAITPEGLAEGFLAIAVDDMANAIKQSRWRSGYDRGRLRAGVFRRGGRASTPAWWPTRWA